jgi:high-affinity Fe2+/Pb2+ permease
MVDVFSVPVFFIIFRETLEAAIIVSVLLSFVRNAIGDDEIALRKRLIKQVSPPQTTSYTRYGSVHYLVSQFVYASEQPSSQYGTP